MTKEIQNAKPILFNTEMVKAILEGRDKYSYTYEIFTDTDNVLEKIKEIQNSIIKKDIK